jgi:hypothetical protein
MGGALAAGRIETMRRGLAVIAIGLGILEVSGAPQPTPGSEVTWHSESCDASAAVALSDRVFVAASDEDSRLRAYLHDESGAPIWSMDVAQFLEVDPKHPETDIEGAARVGDLVYWITSHGRNQKGEWRESRRRFFATRVEGDGLAVNLRPVGRPYRELLDDFGSHPDLQDLDLAGAARRAPKDEGALNIEGLATGPNGTLWVGFRNPIPAGRAVLVQLLNPAEMIEGRRAKLGLVVRLSLAGRGIREITWSGSDYLIVAGSFDGKGKSRIYRWAGPGTEAQRLREAARPDLNPEGLVVFPGSDGTDFFLLSDDGSRKTDGVECKELRDASQRSFRSARVRLGIPGFN